MVLINPINVYDPNGLYDLYINGRKLEGSEKDEAINNYGFPSSVDTNSESNEENDQQTKPNDLPEFDVIDWFDDLLNFVSTKESDSPENDDLPMNGKQERDPSIPDAIEVGGGIAFVQLFGYTIKGKQSGYSKALMQVYVRIL